MNINLKKILIRIIIICTFTFIGLKMYGTYDDTYKLKMISYIIEIVVSILCLIYISLCIKKGRFKFEFNIGILLLLLIYETLIIFINKDFYFPYFISDTFTWPLLLVVCVYYSYEYEMSFKHEKIFFLFYLLMIVISFLLIKKHKLLDNNGEYIFPIYFCITFLPLFLYYVKSKRKKNIILILSIMTVLLSTKRAGTIAIIVGVFIYYLIEAYIQNTVKGKLKNYIKIIILVMIGVFTFYYLATNSNLEIFTRFKKLANDGGSGRDIIWETVYDAYSNSSNLKKIFGHGFQSVYYSLKPLGKNRMAHNSYLEYLYDYGLIGLSIIIIFLLKNSLTCLVMIKEKNKSAPVIAFAIILSVIFSIFSYFYEQSVIIIPIAILLGIVTGETLRLKKEN